MSELSSDEVREMVHRLKAHEPATMTWAADPVAALRYMSNQIQDWREGERDNENSYEFCVGMLVAMEGNMRVIADAIEQERRASQDRPGPR